MKGRMLGRLGGGLGLGFVNSPRRAASWQPGSLFGGTEGGFWFDLTDADMLRQTSVGVPPVATASDPVGLAFNKARWGDKSFAEVMSEQAEIYPEGTVQQNHNISASVSVPEFWFSRTSTSAENTVSVIDNTVTMSGAGGFSTTKIAPNTLFRCRIAWSAQNVSGVELRGNGSSVIGSSNAAAGAIEVLAAFAMDEPNNRPYLRFGGAGSITFTEISFKEVPDKHASQSSAGARPTFHTTHVRGDGSDDRLATAERPALQGTLIYAGTFEAASDVAIGAAGAEGVDACALRVSADGYLQAAIGDQDTTIIGETDIRGVDGVYAIRWGGDGAAVTLTRDLNLEYAGLQVGDVTTEFPFLIGAANVAGAADNFLDGKMRHFIFVPRFISDHELTQAVRFLSGENAA